MNLIGALGALLLLAGAGLCAWGLWRLGDALRRRRATRRVPRPGEGESVWAGAIDPREVYVPGSLVRALAGIGAGAGLALCGLLVGRAGLALGRDFVRLDTPALLATVSFRAGTVRVERPGQAPLEAAVSGQVVVAHGDSLRFPSMPPWTGLGAHFRLSHLASYARSADVLSGRALSRLDVDRPEPLLGLARRLVPRLGPDRAHWLAVDRRLSPPLADGREAELWSSEEGLTWRPR